MTREEPWNNFLNFYAHKNKLFSYYEKITFYERCDAKFSTSTILHFRGF